MKRFFLVPDSLMPAPGQTLGEWHGIDLGTHGAAGAGHHAVVLVDPHIEAPSGWEPLPSLLEASTTLQKHGRGHHLKLADVGGTGAHTALDVARKLHAIHPHFRP